MMTSRRSMRFKPILLMKLSLKKFVLSFDLKRSELRDLYDIWYLFSEMNVSDDFLSRSVIDKLKNEGQMKS